MKECRVIFILTMNIYLWYKITLRQESHLLHTHTPGSFSCCFISRCNGIPPLGASNKQVQIPQTQNCVIILLSFSIANSEIPFIQNSKCVLVSFQGITAPPPP